MAWKQGRVASFCLLPSAPAAGGRSAPDTSISIFYKEEKNNAREREHAIFCKRNQSQPTRNKKTTYDGSTINFLPRRLTVVGFLQGSERPTGRAQISHSGRICRPVGPFVFVSKWQGQLPPKVSKMLPEQGPIVAGTTCLRQGGGTTPRWKNTRCRFSLSLCLSPSLMCTNTARPWRARALDVCHPAAGGTPPPQKKKNGASVICERLVALSPSGWSVIRRGVDVCV